MLYIQKSKGPKSLETYKKQRGSYYNGCEKLDIRKSLLKEQGYLCAYCMRRIDEKCNIEHWSPRNGDDEKDGALDYQNMLGVCTGHKMGTKGKHDTCDASKGNKNITVNPTNKVTLESISYDLQTGNIKSNIANIHVDLDEVLNLNSKEQYLPRNREAALHVVLQRLKKKKPSGQWSKEFLNKCVGALDDSDMKMEYLGIVTWYLQNKINQTNTKKWE